MRTREGSIALIQELGLVKDEEFHKNPLMGQVLKEICTELHYIINLLIDDKNPLLAFTVITAIVKTLRLVLSSRQTDIKQAVKELKERAELRPTLRIGRHGPST